MQKTGCHEDVPIERQLGAVPTRKSTTPRQAQHLQEEVVGNSGVSGFHEINLLDHSNKLRLGSTLHDCLGSQRIVVVALRHYITA